MRSDKQKATTGGDMKLILKSDNNGLDFRFTVNWKSLVAILKALLPVAAAILSLLAAPEVAKLMAMLGLR